MVIDMAIKQEQAAQCAPSPRIRKIQEVFSGQSGTLFLDGKRETWATHICVQPLMNEHKEKSHA
jgi:hypothetical protein